ncbi:MAG TPA: hypothetical protein VIV60_06745, partial [Polyangiaceae bacterium]
GGQSTTSGKGTGGSAASSTGTGSQVGGATSSSSQSSSQSTGGQTTATSAVGQGGTATGGQTAGTTANKGGSSAGGQTSATSTTGRGGATSTGGQTSGTTSSNETGGTTLAGGGRSGTSTTAAAGTGTGKTGGAGGQNGSTATGGQSNGTAGGSGVVSGCVGGKQWPTANPAAAGPFQVAADKGVGPLAGYTPDPIYGDQQQRFNIYRPKNLSDSGYCHPILVWANGHTDNPEPNPPSCVVDSGANKWCGQYLPMMNHLASHGFVVIASLSTTTSRGEPLPTIAGLDWLLKQAEDSTSPYYHRLDTANIGQLGHSEGGMSTCMVASEPRYKALMSICGTRALTGVHTPMLFFCGGKDTVVACSGVRDVFLTVTTQPAFFMNEKDSDHGKWVYGGANGPSLSGAAAWFRVHLMGDTANRKYFYGSGCTFCSDSRVTAEQNSLMAQ